MIAYERRPVLAAAALAAALAGCAPGSGPAAQATVRDSAGIRIVENTGRGTWPRGAEWRVAGEPAGEYGSLEMESGGASLFGVRDAARLSDGRVVVADGGSGELRFFARDGRFLQAAGHRGDGPGEFRLLTALARAPGDSLMAFDSRAGRVSVFSPDGAFRRAYTVGETPEDLAGLLTPVGWLETGTFVARATLVDAGLRPPDGQGRVSYRPGADLRLFTSGGRLTAKLEGFAGNESVTFVNTRGGGGLRMRTVPVPFLKKLESAAAGRTVAVGATDAYEVRLFGAEGRLEKIVRGPPDERKVTPDAVEAWIDEQLAAIDDPERRRARRREFDDLPVPDRLPAFEALLVDAGGRLWVREFDPPRAEPATEPAAARWSVYDPGGALLGVVAMPPRLRPFEIGDDYVLGAWKDEMDVEQVRLYPLLKPASAATARARTH